MKIKNSIIFLLFINVIVFGQNRVNDALPLISKTNFGQLLNATGWLKNNSGQWMSRKNKIPIDIGEYQKTYENYERYSLGENNFISYEMKDIKIRDTTYSLLINKFRDGYYDYPTINEGWHFRNSYSYYIFDKKELEKLKNLKSDSLYSIQISLKATDIIRYVDLKTLTDIKIVKAIQENLNKNSFIDKSTSLSYEIPYTFPYLFIDIQYYKNKNIIQFLISPKIYETENPHYYETDLITFNKFIKLE